ncbi:hypothetical protein NDN08_005957 [Rhodosorus marinus]|uniref:Golgi to ER traffic protein 4 n=1 Tax=Rhodosorus marinus TaxID=101924 RepID=A0AAV8UN74_9RHOD|nr:hypothetical protein NDN08_005957 [Rhodosorus marinus]
MGSVKFLRKRYESALASDDLYTAEQTCLTIVHRMRTRKDVDKSEAEKAGRDMILEGSMALIDRGAIHSGTSLGLELVKTLIEDMVMYRDSKENLFALINAYEKHKLEADEQSELVRLLRACVDFSKKEGLGERMYGDELLNLMTAEALWKQSSFSSALDFFVRSPAPQRCGLMVHEWSNSAANDPKSPLVVVRAVLAYLTSGNLADAIVVVSINKLKRKSDEGGADLLASQIAFSDMLLKIIQRQGAYPLMAKLREHYNLILNKEDQSVQKKLDLVAEMYFGVKPGGNTMQDMMSEVMKGFFGGSSSSFR